MMTEPKMEKEKVYLQKYSNREDLLMIAIQVYNFGWTMLVGLIMGIIFDFFRALRRKGNTKNIMVYIQDILFWIIIAIIIIVSSFIINDGELRGYMLLGYLLGTTFYVLLFSKYVKGFFGLIFDGIEKGFSFIFSPIIRILKKVNKKELKKQEN